MPPSQTMALQIFTEMAAVEQQWRRFERIADCTVFQTFDWLQEWYRHIGAKRSIMPVIILGSNRGRLCFLLPLAIERRGLIRRLIWLGADLSDYNAPILIPNFSRFVAPGQFPDLWNRVITAIEARRHPRLDFDIVDFDRVPETVGPQPNPFCELPVRVAGFSAHCATLPDNWETFYQAKASNSVRQTDRRKHKNLGKVGPIKFVEVDDPAVEPTMTALIRQKQASYMRMGVADLFARQGYEEFFRSIAANPAMRDRVHLTRLDVGDDMAATGLCLQFKDRYYLILPSYDEKYAKFSPGRHHLQELMRYAIERGLRFFDFTIGDESYKLEWSDTHMRIFSYVRFRTVRGTGIEAIKTARHNAEDWYNRPQKLIRTKKLVRVVRRFVSQFRTFAH